MCYGCTCACVATIAIVLSLQTDCYASPSHVHVHPRGAAPVLVHAQTAVGAPEHLRSQQTAVLASAGECVSPLAHDVNNRVVDGGSGQEDSGAVCGVDRQVC
jgi:hypothetical protein